MTNCSLILIGLFAIGIGFRIFFTLTFDLRLLSLRKSGDKILSVLQSVAKYFTKSA
jgi:hypothetical protein